MSAPSAEFCRIERWRGYVTSTFCVRLPDGTVVESPTFRWRHAEPPPDGGAARAAYDELVDRLEGAGWAHHAAGAVWFATTFTRPAGHRAEKAVPPVARPVPEQPRPVAPSRRRQLRVALIAGVALVAAALAFVPVLWGHEGDAKRNPARPAHARRVRTTTSAVTRFTTTAAPVAAKLVDIRVRAHGNGSWIEFHRSSATGPVLYSGTLTDGQTLHLRARKLWARFGAAANLTITADGRPVRLDGTYDKLFVPR